MKVIDLAKSVHEIEVTDEEYARYMRTLERDLSNARHNEAAALRHAEQRGRAEERAKLENLIANKDSALAEQAARIAELERKLGEGK